MRLAANGIQRLFNSEFQAQVSTRTLRRIQSRPTSRLSTKPWICHGCQSRGLTALLSPLSRLPSNDASATRTNAKYSLQRQWSSSAVRQENPPKLVHGSDRTDGMVEQARKEVEAEIEAEPPKETTTPPEIEAEFKSKVEQQDRATEHASAAEKEADATYHASLPSRTKEERWHMAERMQTVMDELLAKAALAGQRVNTYTGTDYSAIETLRKSIIEQERAVKSHLGAVAAAKEAYTSAHTLQASSQKEVVGLLERKHSWAASDLERYMSLIRSEHVNEQAVQKAKDQLADAERALEDSRSNLEKKERKQYHEEQIWSDTIRRNSTWVTFGLMGVNIFLLLANLAIFEPWRRRRLVREVRAALEEKTVMNAPTAVVTAAVVQEVDSVVEPVETPLEKLEEAIPEPEKQVVVESTVPEEVVEAQAAGMAPLATGESQPEEVADIVSPLPTIVEPAPNEEWWRKHLPANWEAYKEMLHDLFSERAVTLKRVDVTTIALEGAAAGVAVMGLLFVLLQPR